MSVAILAIELQQDVLCVRILLCCMSFALCTARNLSLAPSVERPRSDFHLITQLLALMRQTGAGKLNDVMAHNILIVDEGAKKKTDLTPFPLRLRRQGRQAAINRVRW